MDTMYNVYMIQANIHYDGISLVAANTVEEANSFITSFQNIDKENNCDSWGYGTVDEHDIIEGVYSENSGIIHHGIHYSG